MTAAQKPPATRSLGHRGSAEAAAITESRFADAEAWAAQALELGRRVAEHLAVGAYGMQMFCLRREQGRLREALALLQHFVGTTPKAQISQPGLALLYAELDMQPECQAQFEGPSWRQVLAAPPETSTMDDCHVRRRGQSLPRRRRACFAAVPVAEGPRRHQPRG